MNKIKKEAKRPNSIRGTQRFTKPSQTNGNANVQINTETTIPKLEKLAQEYIGITNPYGFLTNLRTALGISNSKGASKYGVVKIPKEDGSVLEASLRITNHNSNAETYISHNANYEYNLSILVRKNFQSNRFKPHDNVKLDEFVYYGKKISKVENPLTQIINSIIGFLQNGVYEDTTGIALKNISPTNENKEYKTNTNMAKKQVIRLTEGDLHRIIKESVKNVMNENQEGVVSENPMINQLWNELMTLKNGLIRDIIRKYGWGKTSDQIGGKVVVKQIMAINNAISTFNAILQGTTADNEEYWSRIEHEQD